MRKQVFAGFGINSLIMSNIDIEQRALRAKELFLSGYNCCQSVVLAFEDITALEPTLATPLCAPCPLFSLAIGY